eukprot:CAMPEP_0202819132 /NCGR_PEP_ID=MMETSP1389-20130828/8872_1 /ASSEMBLY_ACC=CAM_ASM_000865 /TAXON_ID=302021 /ORGANISM="Rhodomonas sp., Strain CCMP768" /LENGTH=66 /DNA_ID=CAMNT_0049491633 /DNA_START=71 /DNA_END=271 /DNA_ORIENTATION=+
MCRSACKKLLLQRRVHEITSNENDLAASHLSFPPRALVLSFQLSAHALEDVDAIAASDAQDAFDAV